MGIVHSVSADASARSSAPVSEPAGRVIGPTPAARATRLTDPLGDDAAEEILPPPGAAAARARSRASKAPIPRTGPRSRRTCAARRPDRAPERRFRKRAAAAGRRRPIPPRSRPPAASRPAGSAAPRSAALRQAPPRTRAPAASPRCPKSRSRRTEFRRAPRAPRGRRPTARSSRPARSPFQPRTASGGVFSGAMAGRFSPERWPSRSSRR